MACILKTPTSNSKGVLSFTNIEYFGQILKDTKNIKLIEHLKKDWVICYHPNWEDHKFNDTGLFDCILSVRGSFSFDQASTGSKRMIETCSNRMAPPEFITVPVEKKIWDFCHVSREQPSKNIRGFFRVVKNAFDIRPDLRGVLIISVKNTDEMNEIRSIYEQIFTLKEREQFEFITLNYNLPFPLSKKTLAHFYNYSKVTLNTHLNEPHGRVVGYGLASGLPVVGYHRLGEMVDKNINKEPIFYLSPQDDESSLTKGLCKAINYVNNNYEFSIHRKVANSFSETTQAYYLKNQLMQLFNLDDEGWNIYNLDSRLSTHYICESSTNTYSASVFELIYFLSHFNSKTDNFDESGILPQVKTFTKKTLGKKFILQNTIKVRAPIEKHKIRKKAYDSIAVKYLRKLKKIIKQ